MGAVRLADLALPQRQRPGPHVPLQDDREIFWSGLYLVFVQGGGQEAALEEGEGGFDWCRSAPASRLSARTTHLTCKHGTHKQVHTGTSTHKHTFKHNKRHQTAAHRAGLVGHPLRRRHDARRRRAQARGRVLLNRQVLRGLRQRRLQRDGELRDGCATLRRWRHSCCCAGRRSAGLVSCRCCLVCAQRWLKLVSTGRCRCCRLKHNTKQKTTNTNKNKRKAWCAARRARSSSTSRCSWRASTPTSCQRCCSAPAGACAGAVCVYVVCVYVMCVVCAWWWVRWWS